MTRTNHNRALLRKIDNERRERVHEFDRPQQLDPNRQKIIDRRQRVREDAHEQFLQIATQWKKTDDAPAAVLAVNELMADLPPSIERSVRPWLRHFFGFSYQESKGIYWHNKVKGKPLDIDQMRDLPWWKIVMS